MISITQMLEKNDAFTPELSKQFKAANIFFNTKIKNIGKGDLLEDEI